MEYKDTVIHNISDYLLWVKDINKEDVLGENNQPVTFENGHAYFRGQACTCWELKPSVLRDPSLDEHALLKKAYLRLFNEVSSLNNYLEKMVFFQHYGLHTRLLDVTFNPLIALYVACCEENKYNCDGVVYCGHSIEYQNSKTAELTAKFVFENELEKATFDFQNFLKLEGINLDSFTKPIFILPPINNPRIEAQNGAFVMEPLFDKILDGIPFINRKGVECTKLFDKRRAIVKGNNKENILHELSKVGVDSGTIYRGIEEKLRAIVTEEKFKSNRIKSIQL